jgi:hypothetical protein
MSAALDRRYGDVLAIADSGNNRVVLWHHLTLPAPSPPAPNPLP